ncbi:MAG: DUF72 domain-containing protein [Chitinophagales bacterium]
MAKGSIHIGTSGWSYRDWRVKFYPEKMKATDYLPFFAERFNCVEINSSFYRMPLTTTVGNWVKKVPADFRFSPKMSKFLTHIKRLKEPEEPLERFFTVFDSMRKVMGPILVQLPPTLKFDYDVAETFYKECRKYKPHVFAMEVRHNSWMTEDSFNLMAKNNIAFVISQSGVGFPYAEMVTAKTIYFRFHGPEKLYASSYLDEHMQEYAHKFLEWQKEGHDIWVYFNNDWFTYAIQNADTLKKMCGLKR